MKEAPVKWTVFAAPSEQQVRLAEIICGRVRAVSKIRFCNSGTEATMHAISAARAFTGRNKILKLEGGYHGTGEIFEASVDLIFQRRELLNGRSQLQKARAYRTGSWLRR